MPLLIVGLFSSVEDPFPMKASKLFDSVFTLVLVPVKVFAPKSLLMVPDTIAAIGRIVLLFYMVFGFVSHASIPLTEMVGEKEKKIKEGLLMQGMTASAFWFSTMIVYGTFALIASFILTFSMTGFFPYTNLLLRIFYFDVPLKDPYITALCFVYYPLGFTLAILKMNDLELRKVGANFENFNASEPDTAETAEETTNPDIEPSPTGLRLLVKLEGITKQFGKAKSPAVDNVSLNLYEGEIFGIIGHNGAGKSSLIHMLTGLTPPTSGKGWIAGGYSVAEDMPYIRQQIGVCPQFDIHHEQLTVEEHVYLFAGIKGFWDTHSKSELKDIVHKALDQLDLLDKVNEPSKSLSGGQRRKLSVAMAMVGSPKILFLDEPSSGMDPLSRRKLWELLSATKHGRLTVLTTHFMDEADLLADRKAILSHGKLRCCGTSLFLKSRFNIGYQVDLVHRPDSATGQYLKGLVHSVFPTSTEKVVIASNFDNHRRTVAQETEIRFSIPSNLSSSFPSLFSKLDEEVSNGRLLYYGVSTPTLEEVFLKSGQEEDSAGTESGDSSSPVSPTRLLEVETLMERLKSNPQAFTRNPTSMQQFTSLINNRILILGRTPWSFISTYLFPIYIIYSVLLSINSNGADPDIQTTAGAEDVTALNIVPLLVLSLYMPTITWVRDVISDRQLKIWPLLRSIGVGVGVYWCANFVVHFVLSAVVVGVLLRMVVVLNVTMFLGAAWLMFVVGCVMCLVSGLWFTYALSLLFTDADLFQTIGWIGSYFGNILPNMVILLFQFSNDTTAAATLHTILSFLLPFYPLSGLLFYMVLLNLSWKEGKIPEPNAWDYFKWENNMLVPLVAMVFHSFVFAGLVFCYEAGSFAKMNKRITQNEEGDHQVDTDEEVILERRRLLDTPLEDLDDPLVLKQLFKVFKLSSTDSTKTTWRDAVRIWLRPPQKIAVRDLTMSLKKGETLILVGPNGAGKSTAMSIAVGQLYPDSGTVSIFSTPVQPRQASDRPLDEAEESLLGTASEVGMYMPPTSLLARRELGYVDQSDTLWPLLTPREHLTLFAELRGVSQKYVDMWVDTLVETLRLEEHVDKKVEELSGGAKRKLVVGMGLVGPGRILALDEPSTGLDPNSKRRLWTLLQTFQNLHPLSLLLSTHSLDEAESLAHRVAILINGHLKCLGSIGALRRRYGDCYILEVSFKNNTGGIEEEKQWVRGFLPAAIDALESFGGSMVARWEIPKSEVERVGGLGKVFEVLEHRLGAHGGAMKGYAFGQMRLEGVFVKMCRDV
ncbi:ATP-binding cassette sub- A member 5 [Chytridiales sp. JEL 0842]|nr:ATP-binding cassette sub- A member 5 [Chytridiales sp. JEL 0842]